MRECGFTPTLKGGVWCFDMMGFTPILKPARLCKTGVACPTEFVQAGVKEKCCDMMSVQKVAVAKIP